MKRGTLAKFDIEKQNNLMLQSTVKEIDHHAKELKSIMNGDTLVDAWVLSKAERASSDLSDITHYLDSRDDLKYAQGGVVKFIKDKDKYNWDWGRKPESWDVVGTMDWVINGSLKYAYLIGLSDFDKEYWKKVYLKPNEMLFRYETEQTKIAKIQPVVKINLEKGIVYFLQDLNSDDDKELVFNPKGVKLKYLNLHERVYADLTLQRNYRMTDTFESGGVVNMSDEELVDLANTILHYEIEDYNEEEIEDPEEARKFLVEYYKEIEQDVEIEPFAKGGRVTFKDKVKAIKKSLLDRRNVPQQLRKEYGKTYSPKEAEESAKRIAGAMRRDEMFADGGELRKIKGNNFSDQIENGRKFKELIQRVYDEQPKDDVMPLNFIKATALTKVPIVKNDGKNYLKGYMYKGTLSHFHFLDNPNFVKALEYVDRPPIRSMKFESGGIMAVGGNIVKGVVWKINWKDTKGNEGYDKLKIVDTKYHTNNYGGGFVVKSEIIESSNPQRVGKFDETHKDELKKIFANKYPFAQRLENGGNVREKMAEMNISLNTVTGQVYVGGIKNKNKLFKDEKGYYLIDGYEKFMNKKYPIKKYFSDSENEVLSSYMKDTYSKGGIVVTSIKDIPDLMKEVNAGRVTYRGLGMGKLSNDFWKIAGQSGTRIKVKGKEYFITDDDYRKLNWDSKNEKWKNLIRFEAPFRKS